METIDARELLRDAPLKMIGARINHLRTQEPRVSLDDFAASVGTSRQHLINLEKGRHRPRLAMLEKIAEALDKPIEYFLVPEAREPHPFPAEPAAAA